MLTRLLQQLSRALRRDEPPASAPVGDAPAEDDSGLRAAISIAPESLAALREEPVAEAFAAIAGDATIGPAAETGAASRTSCVVLAGCDPEYFRNFALAFAQSLARNGAIDAALHLQIIEPDAWIAEEVAVLRSETADMPIRYNETVLAPAMKRDEATLRTIFTCTRLIALPNLLRSYGHPVLLLDIDILIDGSLSAPMQEHAGSDVVMAVNEPQSDKLWMRFVPSPLLIKPTEGGIAFANMVSRYAAHFLAEGAAPWGLDRVALAAAYADAEARGAVSGIRLCQPSEWPVSASLDHNPEALRSDSFRAYLPRLRRAFGWTLPGSDVFFPFQLAHSKILLDRPTWEGPMLEQCAAYFGRRRRALDIGAHVGFWSRWLAHHFERVEAFEPQPLLRECLAVNVEAANLTVHGVALGEREGTVGSEFDPANSGMSHLVDSMDGDIALRRLDDFGFDDVDFIKLDAEGYELFILRGGIETLKRNRPTVLVEQTEWNARYGVEYFAAVAFLESLGAQMLDRMSKYDFLLGWKKE